MRDLELNPDQFVDSQNLLKNSDAFDIKFAGAGLPVLGKANEFGDHRVRIEIEIPTQLNKE